LLVLTLFVWSLVYAGTPSENLRVAFIDVGQGDAIFIESPTGTQVLVDGGKGRAVLRGLGDLMHPADRSLDVVIATHPDLDHIGGLPEVFARYDIGMFFEPGVMDDGSDYIVLKEAVAEEKLNSLFARAGKRLAIGGGAYLEFLFPVGDVSAFEANTGSIITRVVYGKTSFMLTGDAPVSIENYLVGIYGARLDATVLKAGHHGSKTSTGDAFLGATTPEYAIISAGCDNTYGHPHKEVLERLARFKADILQTCTDGTIVFESDGNVVTRQR
jgi:competence protein ComEC